MNLNNDDRQIQTNECFSFKWAQRDSYESDIFRDKVRRAEVDLYFGSEKIMTDFMEQSRGKKILDAGCGSGLSASLIFGKYLNEMQYLGVDSSDAIYIAEQRFAEMGIKGKFEKMSITDMNLKQQFDIIFCSGVLHHTSDPYKSFKNLVHHLTRNGIIMFYIYRKKAPIREFVDDLIRERLSSLSDTEAWEKLIPLTKLGKTLGELNIEITLEDDIELLEIPKGTYNLQRLLYWYFLKMYHDSNFSLQEMNHVNFDWYRPLNCFRFKPEEISTWLKESNLEELRFLTDDAGITVVARKVN